MTFNSAFETFAARLREFIRSSLLEPPSGQAEAPFNNLSLQLFALHFEHNSPYRSFCRARGVSPAHIHDWRDIPALPTAALKEFEVTCLLPEERTTEFHSSGTTQHRPSRNFHSPASLRIYEKSLWPWFARHCGENSTELLIVTPPPREAPHSSLVHMFETIRRAVGEGDEAYVARAADGGWTLAPEPALERLGYCASTGQPLLLLGTAFMFVHLLDYMHVKHVRLQLPPGSRLLETGGYKGRSRSLPKAELHRLLTTRLGVPAEYIVCEYGMSELSSQAYDRVAGEPGPGHFCFPPWCRVQVVSPETRREVDEGETGLLRLWDLANVASVLALQTEDLAIRRDCGFELLGRAAVADPRGCSLMAV